MTANTQHASNSRTNRATRISLYNPARLRILFHPWFRLWFIIFLTLDRRSSRKLTGLFRMAAHILLKDFCSSLSSQCALFSCPSRFTLRYTRACACRLRCAFVPRVTLSNFLITVTSNLWDLRVMVLISRQRVAKRSSQVRDGCNIPVGR